MAKEVTLTLSHGEFLALCHLLETTPGDPAHGDLLMDIYAKLCKDPYFDVSPPEGWPVPASGWHGRPSKEGAK